MYLSEVKKSQCIARVVAYSISAETNEKIITFELEYPRIIHSELLTHRLFSRNAASSRAIPVQKTIDMILENPAMPVRFGVNQPGMQDDGAEYDGLVEIAYGGMGEPIFGNGREAWKMAANDACKWAKRLTNTGYHKQVAARCLEAYQHIKTVLTFTGGGSNFFGLRKHPDADPTICELAEAMYEAMTAIEPKQLKAGDWHLPYYKEGYFIKGEDRGLEMAKRISASCCAQVSYRKLDDSVEKADSVFKRLVESKPVHASPLEHQATPLKKGIGFRSKYVTHQDRYENSWSGNFRNWGQFRQEIVDNVIPDVSIQ